MGRPVGTQHIAMMYDEAARLARTLHGMSDEDDGANLPDGTRLSVDGFFAATLDRIDNLVTHARAELVDEQVRLKHRWPVV